MTHPQASRAYIDAYTRAEALREQLLRAMQSHQAMQAVDSHNWGYVGDMNSACDHIAEALRIFGFEEARHDSFDRNGRPCRMSVPTDQR